MDRYLVISSDCHAGLTPKSYRDYLDPQYREKFDEQLAIRQAALETAGRSLEMAEESAKWAEGKSSGLSGAWDHDKRIEVIDADGVAGEVLFPVGLTEQNSPPFGDDLGMVISRIGERSGGVFHKGDELVRITDVELDTEYEEGTRFHKALRASLKLSDGTAHTLEGTVTGFIPLRNRRSGKNTAIGEGMTEYVLDGDRVGYGLSEYLDQPED